MIHPKTALVTGASSGIGLAYAQRLAADGYGVIMVARRKDRLEELGQLVEAAGGTAEVLAADLADRGALADVAARAAEPDVELVVNNAGFGAYGPFVELDPATADALIDVHVRATTQISRAVLPHLVAAHRGAVINVASLLAWSGTMPPEPLPRRTVYAAAKAFIVTFTELLAGELAGTGVRVQACLPGVVATEFHTVKGMDMSAMPRMSAADTVQASVAALAAGEVICVPALDDPAVVSAIGEAQRTAMSVARAPEIAKRYRIETS